jgi:hypothetical protein
VWHEFEATGRTIVTAASGQGWFFRWRSDTSTASPSPPASLALSGTVFGTVCSTSPSLTAKCRHPSLEVASTPHIAPPPTDPVALWRSVWGHLRKTLSIEILCVSNQASGIGIEFSRNPHGHICGVAAPEGSTSLKGTGNWNLTARTASANAAIPTRDGQALLTVTYRQTLRADGHECTYHTGHKVIEASFIHSQLAGLPRFPEPKLEVVYAAMAKPSWLEGVQKLEWFRITSSSTGRC